MSNISDIVNSCLDNPLFVPQYIHSRIKRWRNPGTNILHEDWDNIIILDACRLDNFRKNHESVFGECQLDTRISRGSNTVEFLQSTFGEGQYPEIIYISANAQLTKLNAKFFKRERLWETHWNEELNTVLPGDVIDQAEEIQSKFPDKRLIIHFVQPHYPFIGKTGRQINHRGQFGNQDRIWEKLQKGAISEKKVYEAYEENVLISMLAAKRMLSKLEGLTVITSDHGNEFGKYGYYGHPGNRYSKNLVRVPWVKSQNGSRKTISKGETTVGPIDSNSRAVRDRLRDLGYME